MPLVKLREGDVNTQYDMDWVERIGLLKFDFLGLRNLTVMKKAIDEIRRTTKADFDLVDDPDDDASTYEMLGRGETIGVFQLESDGMKRVCVELQPVAFRRHHRAGRALPPGADGLDPGLHRATSTAARRPHYLHPKLEPILAETYGIACYQEQVMQIARDVAGFTHGRSRRAAQGHGEEAEGQDSALPREVRRRRAARQSGIERALAEEIFAFIEPFAGYGFNKSHAAAYGWIAYQTGVPEGQPSAAVSSPR